jgi:hypothetical protein
MKFIALILAIAAPLSPAVADSQKHSLEMESAVELTLDAAPSGPPCFQWQQELKEISSIARACARNNDTSRNCRSIIKRVKYLNYVLEACMD